MAGTHMNGDGVEVDTWYSGKYRFFGADVWFLSALDGTPVVGERCRAGLSHDSVAAREGCLPARYESASEGLPTLADFGCQGAGIGIRHPFKEPRGVSH